MEFFNTALASAEEERAQLRRELKKQKLHCRHLAQLAAPSQRKLEAETPALRTEGDSVPAETHQALQVAMDQLQVSECPLARARAGGDRRGRGLLSPDPALWLQSRFTEVMQGNVDLKERIEELEHRCIQLSGETDTIGEQEGQGPGRERCVVGGDPQKLSPVHPPARPALCRRLHHPVSESEGSVEGAPSGEGGVHKPAG